MSTLVRAPVVFLVFALAAAAQSPVQDWNNIKALADGTSVRISIGSRTISGPVRAVSDDSLAVDSSKGPETFTRRDVLRVSVKKQSHRGRNTLIGLGTGAALGAVAGAASHRDCTGFCILNVSRAEDAGIAAILFGVVGAAVGVLIPTGGWRDIYKQ